MFMSQDGLTGSAWGDWANYTASPLRAFENELGVQAPVGFWDPAGFTSDGSVEDFKRRRQTELKHGRISMLATMGYITPEKLSINVHCAGVTRTLRPKLFSGGNMGTCAIFFVSIVNNLEIRCLFWCCVFVSRCRMTCQHFC